MQLIGGHYIIYTTLAKLKMLNCKQKVSYETYFSFHKLISGGFTGQGHTYYFNRT